MATATSVPASPIDAQFFNNLPSTPVHDPYDYGTMVGFMFSPPVNQAEDSSSSSHFTYHGGINQFFSPSSQYNGNIQQQHVVISSTMEMMEDELSNGSDMSGSVSSSDDTTVHVAAMPANEVSVDFPAACSDAIVQHTTADLMEQPLRSSSTRRQQRAASPQPEQTSMEIVERREEEDRRRHLAAPPGASPQPQQQQQTTNITSSSTCSALLARYCPKSLFELKTGTLRLDDSQPLIQRNNPSQRITIRFDPKLVSTVGNIVDELQKSNESSTQMWTNEQFKQWRQQPSSTPVVPMVVSSSSSQVPPVIPDIWMSVLKGHPGTRVPSNVFVPPASLQSLKSNPSASNSSFIQLLDWIMFQAVHPSAVVRYCESRGTNTSLDVIEPLCTKAAINAYYWLTAFVDMTTQHDSITEHAVNVASSKRFVGPNSMFKWVPEVKRDTQQILLHMPYNPSTLHSMRFPYGQDTSGGMLYYVASRDMPGMGMLYSQIDFNLLIRTFNQYHSEDTNVELVLSRHQVMVVDLLPPSTRQAMANQQAVPASTIMSYYDFIANGVRIGTSGTPVADAFTDAKYIMSNDVMAEPLVCALSPMSVGMATMLPRSQHNWVWDHYTSGATAASPIDRTEVIFMNVCVLLLD